MSKSILIGAIVFIGVIIGGLISFLAYRKTKVLANPSAKLLLREEQLDISKKTVQTGDVTVHRDVLTEDKNIIVPVTREELVIKKGETETMRIPVCEEQIEITRHPVALNDVSVYHRKFQETETVQDTVRKEELRMDVTGDPEIIEKETEKHPG